MELIQLDTKNLIGHEVVMTVNTIKKIGRKIDLKFTKARTFDQTQKLKDTKKKNKFTTFKESNTKGHFWKARVQRISASCKIIFLIVHFISNKREEYG